MGTETAEAQAAEMMASTLASENCSEFHHAVGEVLFGYLTDGISMEDALDGVAGLFVRTALANERLEASARHWHSVDCGAHAAR